MIVYSREDEEAPRLESAYKVCGVCGRVYLDRVQYLAETTPVRGNPDYPEGKMPDEEGPGHFFELRNCRCGATLAVRIHNSRDLSPPGLLRRELFDDLLELFMTRDGVDRSTAHQRIMSKYGLFFRGNKTST